MARKANIWTYARAIKILRLNKFSHGEIETLLGKNLHLIEREDGTLIEHPGDAKIISFAYEQNLNVVEEPKFSTAPYFFDRKRVG